MHLEQGKDVEAAILDGAHADRAAGARLDAVRSASCSCRCSCWRASPGSCSCRWPRRWCSRCWPPTCCRARWCRRWRSTGCNAARCRTPAAAPRGRFGQLAGDASSAASSGARAAITTLLERGAAQRHRASPLPFLGAMAATALLAFPLGRSCPVSARTSFPTVDAGQIKLHVRAPHRHCASRRPPRCAIAVEATIREVIPAQRARQHRRQHRPALQRHQSRLQHLGAGRARAMPTSSSISPSDHQPTARLRARAARAADGALSLDDASPSCRRTWSARS